MATIEHEITINASPEKIYTALNTVNGLKSWHSAQIEGECQLNHTIVTKGKDKPTFVWKIITLEPNHRLVWECIEGPGNSVGTQAAYSLLLQEDGRVIVECSHMDWPDKQGNFRKCNTLWGILLHHLKNYVETGKATPTFK